jgi:hypothetical protein
MLPTKIHVMWRSGFRGKDFLEIDQSETRIAYVIFSSKTPRPDPLTNMAATGNSCF